MATRLRRSNHGFEVVNALLQIGLVAISAMTLIRLSRAIFLDYDSMHDGFMSSTAIALRAGLLPYVQYFAQYGVIPDSAHAIGISILFWLSPAQAIRLVALIAVGVSMIIWLISPALRLQRSVTLSAVTLLLALHDIHYGVGFVPWSNLYLNVGLLLMLVVIAGWRLTSVDARTNAAKALLLAGGVLAVLSRPQFVFFVPSVYCVLFLRTRKSLITGLGALVLIYVGLFLTFWNSGIVILYRPTIDYFIDWFPRHVAVNWQFFIAGLAVGLIPMLPVRRNTRWTFLAVATPLLLIVTYQIQFESIDRVWAATWFKSSFAERSLVSIYDVSLGALLTIAILRLVRLLRSKILDTRGASDLSIALIGLVGCAQLFPVPDTRHMWYSLVPAVFSLAILAAIRTPPRFVGISMMLFTTVASVFLYTITQDNYSNYLSLPRVEQRQPLVSGMWNMDQTKDVLWTWSNRGPLDVDLMLLTNNLKDGESAVFLVDDAVFSVFDGTWRSRDKSQVHWAAGLPPIAERLSFLAYPTVVLQKNPDSDIMKGFAHQLTDLGYTQVIRGQRIDVLRRP